MTGGAKSPSIPAISVNQRGETCKSGAGNGFNIGYEEFPRLSNSFSEIGGDSNPEISRSKINFASFFKDRVSGSSSTKLSFEEPKNPAGESIPFFSSGELQTHIDLCENYVVGYFVGRKLAFPFVKEKLKNLWNIQGEVSMTVYGEQAFLFKFTLEEDRKMVLELGSVHIANKLFLIRPWSPFIEQQIGSIKTVPVWMILRDVPLHLWNATGFSKIASYVGKPIMTDTPTAMKTRMAYARICVEIDVNCSFPEELPFQIENEKFKVRAEYPWRPTSCSHCKSFGHSTAMCNSNTVQNVNTKWIPKTSNSSSLTGTSNLIDRTTSLSSIPEVEIVVENQQEIEQEENQASIESHLNGTVTEKDGVLEMVEQPIEVQWTASTRKKKNNRKKGDTHKEVETCCLNSFNILASETGATDFENSGRITSPSHEGAAARVGFEDNNEDIEKSDEEMGVQKVKSLDDIPRTIPMASAQQVEKMCKFAALLGASGGCSEEGKRKIFGELNEKYQKTRQEREMEKLGWKGEHSNEQLGRGQRKSTKKK